MARDCTATSNGALKRGIAATTRRPRFVLHRRAQGGDRAARQLQRRGALQGRLPPTPRYPNPPSPTPRYPNPPSPTPQGRVYGRAAAGRDLPRRHPRRGQLCRVRPGRRGLHRRDDRVGRVWQRARPGDRAAGRRVKEHGDARVTPLCVCNRMPRPAEMPRSHPPPPLFVCGAGTQRRGANVAVKCGAPLDRGAT